MESRCNNQHFRHSRQLLADEASKHSRRAPLSHSTGNSHHNIVASSIHHHEDKGFLQPVDRPLHPLRTPSSSPRGRTPSSLESRRHNVQRQRQVRHSRISITELPQYRAYRDRQTTKSSGKKIEDSKWPDVLEDAFLKALQTVPNMDRAKFEIDGVPHGRNQMISRWLWIAYLQSLAPGERPNENMRRCRKMVMSHLQVLNGFLVKGGPRIDDFYPVKIVENYQENPILIGLAEGRLPTDQADAETPNSYNSEARAHLRPSIFWLLIASSSGPNDSHGHSPSVENLRRRGVIAHRYSGLVGSRERSNLGVIPGLTQRYPKLASLQSAERVDCDLIHMDVSISLMAGRPAAGAQLLTKLEMTLPGAGSQQGRWQTTISHTKPSAVRQPESEEPPDYGTYAVPIVSSNDTETRLKIAFPVKSWMYTFTHLARMQESYQKLRAPYDISKDLPTPADILEKISMYQEVQFSPAPGQPFIRRAIIIWTFREAGPGENGGTTWRYLDTTSPGRRGISTSPRPSHALMPGMHGKFHNREGTQDRSLQNGNMGPPNMHREGSASVVSSYMTSSTRSMVSSPQPDFHSNAGSTMHSPFIGHDFNTYQSPYFTLPPHHANSLSFASASHTPINTHDPNLPNMGDYIPLSNSGIALGSSFSPAPQDSFQGWQLQQRDALDPDLTWWDYGISGENLLGAGWRGDHNAFANEVGGENANALGLWTDGQQGWVIEEDHIGDMGRGMEWIRGGASVGAHHKEELNYDDDDDDNNDDCGNGSGSSSSNASGPEPQLQDYEARQRSIDEVEMILRLGGSAQQQHQSHDDNESDHSSVRTGKATISSGSVAARKTPYE